MSDFVTRWQRSALLILLPLFAAPSLVSAAHVWKPLRIGAGGWLTGLDISADGSTRLVRTDTYGAYVWDAGQWKQLVTASSMPAADVGVEKNEGVYEIRVAPGNASRLYMSYRGYVYRSDDRGAHWTKTAFAQATMEPNDDYRMYGQKMAVDPANPDVVYAGTQNKGLLRSYDGGASWQAVGSVPVASGAGITGIAFDPSSGTTSGRTNTVYAGAAGNGVWRTTDAGATWAKLSGSPNSIAHAVVASDGVFYATGTGVGAVWRLQAGVWTNVRPDGGQYWHSVMVDPSNPARIVAGTDGGSLSQSQNRGTSWGGVLWTMSRQATDIPWLAWTKEDYMSNGDMRFDPTTPNKLWFAQGIGVWTTTIATTQSSVVWTSQSAGIEQLVANAIAAPPGGKPVVASWDRPLFYSANPDAFPAQHGPNKANAIVMGWQVDYASTNPTFLAAVADWWGVEQSGYSTDGGQTWTVFPSMPAWGEAGMGTMAVSTPDNIVWAPSNKKAPYVTKNRGASWQPISLPGVSNWTGLHSAYYLNRHIVAADRVNAGTFYMYLSTNGLFRSTDGGTSWTLVKSGEIVPFSSFNAKLKTVPGKAGHLFFTAGQQDGGLSGAFMRSTDGGVTWTTIPNVLEVYAFGFGKEAPGTTYPAIYIAGWVGGVYGIWQSTNEGQSWTQIADFPTGSLDEVKAVEGDKNTFGTVYVGFSGSGYAYGVQSGGTPVTYDLNVAKAGTGAGTVTSSPAGINCGADCAEPYAPDTLVTLTASPAAGSTFSGWSGACTGLASCPVTMNAAKSVTATFTLNPVTYNLSVAKSGTGSGTVTSTPAGISCGADCSELYLQGTVVTLAAAPAAGSSFSGWSGACTGTASCVVTMNAIKSVTATFAPVTYALTVAKAGTGTGTVTSTPAGISCGADCTEPYNTGTVVTLAAAPAAGSSFSGWSGACTGTASCVVTMNAIKSVTATFAPVTYALTVAKAGTGTGTVTSTPAGISCGADCTEPYNTGTVVTLAAAPAAGSSFSGWSGACTGTASCVVTMNAIKSVTATFAPVTYALTVAKAGTGTGTVTSTPAGISCGADCTEPYNTGTVVTLAAAPAAGSSFSGWSGACTGTASCVVTMNAIKSVTATFAPVTYALTVAKAGTGTGTVTSTPAGISCGADCTEPYNTGTVVTLAAAPAAGSSFSGWSGACTGTASCVVTMNAIKSVTATFAPVTYALTVAKAGTGTGTVTSTPAGISCGADCTEPYNTGTVVTLAAAPAAGSSFSGWSGACTGTASCVVTMNAIKSVTATFAPVTYALTVAKAGTGTGTVTSTPAGISCGADCTEPYNTGTVVTLAAAPAAGSSFSGWSGACTGTASCVVTMNAIKSVTATFAATVTYPLTVSRTGDGSGNLSSAPAGIDCGADCTENYAMATAVALTPTPISGSVFKSWSGACTGTGSCQVTMSAAKSVDASFALAMYSLTVTTSGSGSGTVTSTPVGINCGADCTEPYNTGTVVSLTATPASGSTFGGWTGACTGTTACQVTVDAAKSVTAAFTNGAAIPPGDFDRDGKADLLWHHQIQRLALHLVPGQRQDDLRCLSPAQHDD